MFLGFAVRNADLGYCNEIEYTTIKEQCVDNAKQAMVRSCSSDQYKNVQECIECCQGKFPQDETWKESCTRSCVYSAVG